LARAANPSHAHTSSIEIGASRFTRQLQWQGMRFNIKTSSEVVLYADYANVQASNVPLSSSATAEFAGHGFGAGIVFPLDQRVISKLEFAVNLSTHYALLPETKTSIASVAGNPGKLLQRQSVVKLLIGPLDPVLENGLSWFATIAFIRGDAQVKLIPDSIKYRATSELAIGVGLMLPFHYTELYAGVEADSQHQLVNVGFRYPF